MYTYIKQNNINCQEPKEKGLVFVTKPIAFYLPFASNGTPAAFGDLDFLDDKTNTSIVARYGKILNKIGKGIFG
jgi:hypothetical protein